MKDGQGMWQQAEMAHNTMYAGTERWMWMEPSGVCVRDL